MKTRLLTISLIACVVFGCRDHKNPMKPADERPDDVVNLELCHNLYQNILSLFPEKENNETKYPALFGPQNQTRIKIIKETEVYVTFIGESATRSNTLGWYSYPSNEQPHASGIAQKVIFPHISNTVLSSGDTRKVGVGKFKAGTILAFYLIPGGWNQQDHYVDFGKPVFYLDAKLNKSGAKQSVVFLEEECSDIVVAFEDVESSKSDYDFNDILFKVSDNNQQRTSVSFDTSSIVRLK